MSKITALSAEAVEYLAALVAVDDGENAPSGAVLDEIDAALRAASTATITLNIQTDDVATLREVFHLALIQSEATLNDADLSGSGVKDAEDAHNTAVSLMGRIDATLPDSTGFFD